MHLVLSSILRHLRLELLALKLVLLAFGRCLYQHLSLLPLLFSFLAYVATHLTTGNKASASSSKHLAKTRALQLIYIISGEQFKEKTFGSYFRAGDSHGCCNSEGPNRWSI